MRHDVAGCSVAIAGQCADAHYLERFHWRSSRSILGGHSDNPDRPRRHGGHDVAGFGLAAAGEHPDGPDLQRVHRAAVRLNSTIFPMALGVPQSRPRPCVVNTDFFLRTCFRFEPPKSNTETRATAPFPPKKELADWSEHRPWTATAPLGGRSHGGGSPSTPRFPWSRPETQL